MRRLIAGQFPEWTYLPIRLVAQGGSDNKTFHLGEEMLVRLPSGSRYAAAVEREQRWLPFLGPKLPVSIPKPVVMGEPTEDYPLPWSIYGWISGETLHYPERVDSIDLGKDLGNFLMALQAINATNGPKAGPESFRRGGSLSVYAEETAHAIEVLQEELDVVSVLGVWSRALGSNWEK